MWKNFIEGKNSEVIPLIDMSKESSHGNEEKVYEHGLYEKLKFL